MADQTPIVPGGTKYPANAHARRVAAEMNMPKGLILLQGAQQRFYPQSDQPIPFRQNRQFYYMTGCTEPGSWMTYNVASDKLILWLPKPLENRAVFFDGKGCTKKEAKEKHDVEEVKIIQGPKGKPKCTNLRKMLFDHYDQGGEYAFFKMPNKLIGKKLRLRMKERRKIGLLAAMNKCRAVKDEYEVALIRKANAVSAEAHADVMKQLHFLKSEQEIETLFLTTCLANGAKWQAYDPICGAGKNAGQLHYVKNNADFDENAQVLLVDAGAEWNHYASDITRTLPLNLKNPGAWPSAEAEAVYNWVATIQDECIAQLKAGKKFIEVHWYAVHRTIDALLQLGVLKGEHMDIFHAGTVLAFFPHGLGHHVGLDVHDVSPMAIGKKGNGAGSNQGGPGKKNGGSGKKDNGAGPKKNGAGAGNKGKGQGMNKPMPMGAKKPSWGKPMTKPKDPEKEVLFDADAEKQSLLNKDAEKKGKKNANAGPKNGNGKMQGNKKNKPAGPKKNPAAPQDPRFLRTRGAYTTFATSNSTWNSKVQGLKPIFYSLRPRNLHAPNTPTSPALVAGNVVTIEPGIYFNKFMLNNVFLNNKKHAAFIDRDVLAKFIPVGGVRIEDVVLITETGGEVLSAGAPKGGEMVGLIKESSFVSV